MRRAPQSISSLVMLFLLTLPASRLSLTLGESHSLAGRQRIATPLSSSICIQSFLISHYGQWAPHLYIFSNTPLDSSSGDWAGNVWSQSGPPGQEQSCAQRTGVSSCTDFVQNNGGAFAQACAYYMITT